MEIAKIIKLTKNEQFDANKFENLVQLGQLSKIIQISKTDSMRNGKPISS